MDLLDYSQFTLTKEEIEDEWPYLTEGLEGSSPSPQRAGSWDSRPDLDQPQDHRDVLFRQGRVGHGPDAATSMVSLSRSRRHGRSDSPYRDVHGRDVRRPDGQSRPGSVPNCVAPADQGSTVTASIRTAIRNPPEAEAAVQVSRPARSFSTGRRATPDGTLTRGDVLLDDCLPWDQPDAPRWISRFFEDEDVLALAKPSGLPVLPGGFFLENTLLYLVRRRFGAASSPLHRLGRGTSGAILFTRNPRSARSLAKAMFDRRILKVYLTLASGTSMPDAFTVDAPIGPVPHRLPRPSTPIAPAGVRR